MNIKAIHTAFASAVALVNQAKESGIVSQSRASANASQFKATTVTLADTSKMGENDLAKLKQAIRLYNAGYAFQNAYGVNLAKLNDTHQEKTVEAPSPTVESIAPAKAPKEQKKAA